MAEVVLSKRGARELRKLERSGQKALYAAVLQALEGLAEDPYPEGSIDLGGREGYRIRVREYRILYSVSDNKLVVEVLRVGPRGDVYK